MYKDNFCESWFVRKQESQSYLPCKMAEYLPNVRMNENLLNSAIAWHSGPVFSDYRTRYANAMNLPKDVFYYLPFSKI